MIGTQILNYKITKKIGQGGMATVYEAKHITFDNRKVAIKILDPILSRNKDITSRFKNEAKIMASLDHPNIVKVVDFESKNEILAIIMEFLDGKNLKNLINNNSLSHEQKLNIFKQILPAFDYGHQQKVIHRDIKPSNIFLTDNYSTAKILDFGIAKLLDSDNLQTATGMSMGTPMFMSPEQVRGKRNINQKTDIYSLGVLLYYIISEKTPYDKNDSQYDILTKIVNQPIPELKNENQLNLIIKKATAKNPNERYLNCQEFLNALDNNNELSGFISINKDFLEPDNKQGEQKKIQEAELERQENEKKQAEQKRIWQEERKKLEQDKILAEEKKQQKAELERQENEKKQAEQKRIWQEERKKLEQDKILTEQKKQQKAEIEKQAEQKRIQDEKLAKQKQEKFPAEQQIKPKKEKKKKSKKWLLVLLLLILIFFSFKLINKNSLFAPKIWDKNYGGTKNDEAYSILIDNEKMFICGFTKSFGTSMNWYLLNVNSGGKVIWEKDIKAFNRGATAHAIIKTNDNNYLVVGGTYKNDTYKSQNRIMKFDKKGNIIWNKYYGYFGWDEAVDVTNADNNSFIFVFTDDTNENTRCGIFKINSKGNLIWEQSIGEYGDYSPRDIIKINDSEYLISGKVSISKKTTKAFIAKISNKGDILFSKTIGDRNKITSANSIAKTKNGRFIITGYTENKESRIKDVWLAKIKPNGELLKNINLPEGGNQTALSIAKTFDNNFVLAGYTSNSSGIKDGLIIKIDDDLNVLWEQTYGNTSNDIFRSITATKKYIIATGYTTSATNNKDIWIVKTNTNGEIE